MERSTSSQRPPEQVDSGQLRPGPLKPGQVRTALLTGGAGLAVLAAYLLGGSGGGSATAAEAEQADPGAATIRLTGTGEAMAVPDEASFDLAVTTKRDHLEDALDAGTSALRRVLAALDDLGVAEEDVSTTGLSMHPEYAYPSEGPPVLTGYRVTQRVEVRVPDLRLAGRAVTAAVEAGGDAVRVGSLRLRVGDPDAVLAEARDAAVEEATAKAEQYAAATGQSLGTVVRLRELGGRPAPEVWQVAGRAELAADAVPIRAGEQELKVRVEVVWSLDQP